MCVLGRTGAEDQQSYPAVDVSGACARDQKWSTPPQEFELLS